MRDEDKYISMMIRLSVQNTIPERLCRDFDDQDPLIVWVVVLTCFIFVVGSIIIF